MMEIIADGGKKMIINMPEMSMERLVVLKRGRSVENYAIIGDIFYNL